MEAGPRIRRAQSGRTTRSAPDANRASSPALRRPTPPARPDRSDCSRARYTPERGSTRLHGTGSFSGGAPAAPSAFALLRVGAFLSEQRFAVVFIGVLEARPPLADR